MTRSSPPRRPSGYDRHDRHRPFTRSHGIPTVGGFVVGGGHTGATTELDQLVAEGAERLAALSGGTPGAVTVRFNSNRRSGGAFLRTAEQDSMGANCELGINWGIHSEFDENDEAIPGSERCHGSVLVRPEAMRDDAPDMPDWDDDPDPYVTIPMASNNEAVAWIAGNCVTDPTVIVERLAARRAEFETFAAWPAGITPAKVRKAGCTGWTFGDLQAGDRLVHIEGYGSKPRLGARTGPTGRIDRSVRQRGGSGDG